jgi:hypothetical protein
VHAWRATDGRWSLAPLLKRPTGNAAVPVTVEDATLLLEDATQRSRATLRQISLAVDPPAAAGQDAAVVRGTCSGDLFDQAGFEGRFVPGTGAFDVAGTVDAIELSKRLMAAVPPPAAGWLAGLEPVRLEIEGDQLVLEAGLDDRWRLARLEAAEASAAQIAFAAAREQAGGLQFIAVQSDPDQPRFEGFWMLRDLPDG